MLLSVTILGSGAAVPTSKRSPTAQAVKVDERVYLLDCAEGTQMQLRRFKIKLLNIKAVFISHLHGDHAFGLPGLLSTFSLLERTEPFTIFAPPLLEKWIADHMKYFTPLSFPLHFHELNAKKQEQIFEDKRITVDCFPLKHRIPTWGFLFKEKENPLNIRKDMIDFYRIPIRDIPNIKAGADFRAEDGSVVPNAQLTLPSAKPRSYAFCTDTAYTDDELSNALKDVDLLYHEATFGNDEKTRAKETFHSTAEDAARVAHAANAKKLIIGHFSSRYKDIEPLLEEARRIFPNTEAAEDGSEFVV